MTNVGIISINRYSKHLNYGAALHTFAFQRYLDKHGVENTIIDFMPRFMKGYSMKYPFLTPPPKRRVARTAFWLVNAAPNLVKYQKFMKFFDLHYRSTATKYDEESLRNAILPFDTVIFEADVIWSPHTTVGFENAYFGNLPSMQGMNKISYAASIGYTRFSEERQEQFRELLKGVDHISLREVPGAEFAQEFTDKPVTAVLDPTLLLDAEDYADVCVKPPEKGYVLVYNCLKNNMKMVRDAQKIAAARGLDVVEISVYIHNKRDHTTHVSPGIEQFLGYFANADYVLTNAFHGLCFSTVFKKDFLAYARGTKDSRVTSLLGLLGLDEHFMPPKTPAPDLPPIDWDEVYVKLEEQRRISRDFLFNAINAGPRFDTEAVA